MSSVDARKHVLCSGIAVLDMLFRVASFPRPEVKTQASEFRTVNGGNAANAAVAIAHLGARASFAGPLGGPAGVDSAMVPVADRELHQFGGAVRRRHHAPAISGTALRSS